jgi:hypothetical protein
MVSCANKSTLPGLRILGGVNIRFGTAFLAPNTQQLHELLWRGVMKAFLSDENKSEELHIRKGSKSNASKSNASE